MDRETLIALLEQEWDQFEGFLGQLRGRVFDEVGYKRFLQLLQSIDFDAQNAIDKRVVSLLWFIPTFMMWQGQSLEKAGFDNMEFNNATDKIINELYRILGVP